MKKNTTQPTSLKVNSLLFLKALKVKIAKSSSDQLNKTPQQRNNTSTVSKSIRNLGMA